MLSRVPSAVLPSAPSEHAIDVVWDLRAQFALGTRFFAVIALSTTHCALIAITAKKRVPNANWGPKRRLGGKMNVSSGFCARANYI